MNEEILQFVSKSTGLKDVELQKLHGDASYRIYFRAKSGDKSFIVMKMPDGKSSPSEEITNYSGKVKELPFINILKYFEGLKICVPKLIAVSDDRKIIILEDLGDELFIKRLQASPERKRDYYCEAIKLLADIQRRTTDKKGSIAFDRSFDESLLNWEFEHFLEFGVEARLGRVLDPKSRGEFKRLSREFSRTITQLKYIFTHRDFQSRNLIWKNNDLYIIDFQDALKGPYVYDLVALLRDSYVRLDMDFVNEMIAHYCNLTGSDVTATKMAFHTVTVQRKLKDAGRFVFIDRVKGNPNYLQHIPTSLENVRLALIELKEKKFYEFLKDYIPEWR